jgi:hypothetical protein
MMSTFYRNKNVLTLRRIHSITRTTIHFIRILTMLQTRLTRQTLCPSTIITIITTRRSLISGLTNECTMLADSCARYLLVSFPSVNTVWRLSAPLRKLIPSENYMIAGFSKRQLINITKYCICFIQEERRPYHLFISCDMYGLTYFESGRSTWNINIMGMEIWECESWRDTRLVVQMYSAK